MLIFFFFFKDVSGVLSYVKLGTYNFELLNNFDCCHNITWGESKKKMNKKNSMIENFFRF